MGMPCCYTAEGPKLHLGASTCLHLLIHFLNNPFRLTVLVILYVILIHFCPWCCLHACIKSINSQIILEVLKGEFK